MRTRLMSLGLAAMVTLSTPTFMHEEAAAQSYVDPRSSMSGYESWCQSMGGTAYNDRRGVGCSGVGQSSPGGQLGGSSS